MHLNSDSNLTLSELVILLFGLKCSAKNISADFPEKWKEKGKL